MTTVAYCAVSPGGRTEGPAQQIERDRRPELPPIQASRGEELEQVPQVVAVSCGRVRTITGVEKVL